MKKTVILSTNDNPDYINYLPYVQKAWNNLGWNTLLFYMGNQQILCDNTDNNKIIYLNKIPKYRDIIVVQTSRLLGHLYCEGLIMTSDIDMIPLCDYWKPNSDFITSYGYDLTFGKHFPMCYIAASHDNWKCLIPENSIEELLDSEQSAKSEEFYDWWFTDQNIITKRIKKNFKKLVIINRGFDGEFALGRIDRANWKMTKASFSKKIDAHMPRPFSEFEAKYLLEKYFK